MKQKETLALCLLDGIEQPGGSLNVFHLHTMELFVRLFVEIDY